MLSSRAAPGCKIIPRSVGIKARRTSYPCRLLIHAAGFALGNDGLVTEEYTVTRLLSGLDSIPYLLSRILDLVDQ